MAAWHYISLGTHPHTDLNKACIALYFPDMIEKSFIGKSRIVSDLKATDWLTDRVISLPMHTELDEEQENALRLVALRPNDFTVSMR